MILNQLFREIQILSFSRQQFSTHACNTRAIFSCAMPGNFTKLESRSNSWKIYNGPNNKHPLKLGKFIQHVKLNILNCPCIMDVSWHQQGYPQYIRVWWRPQTLILAQPSALNTVFPRYILLFDKEVKKRFSCISVIKNNTFKRLVSRLNGFL